MTSRPGVRRLPLVARILALGAVFLIGGCAAGGRGVPTIPPAGASSSAASSGSAAHPGPTYPAGCPTAQPPALASDATRTVTIATPRGNIVIAVKASTSPIATANFVALAGCGYYDGVVFHRAVAGFVIQGGDGQFGRTPDVIPDLVGSGGPPYEIQDEPVSQPYVRGTVAMAKGRQPNSASSQFFIVLSDDGGKGLEPTYQIVGTVTSGMEVADAIAAAANGQELPAQPVPMTKVTVATP